MQNVVHFNNPDGATSHAAMFTYLIANWLTPLRASQNNNFSWLSMSIQTVHPSGSVASLFTISPGGGDQAGDMAPPVIAALLQIRTGFPGKRGRGRIYVPGMPINYFNTIGKLNAGAYAQMQTNFLNAWRTKFLSGGSAPITLGICKRSSPGAGDINLAIAIDVRNYAAVQRRRNYFIGV
jgi:hypothetical protein